MIVTSTVAEPPAGTVTDDALNVADDAGDRYGAAANVLLLVAAAPRCESE